MQGTTKHTAECNCLGYLSGLGSHGRMSRFMSAGKGFARVKHLIITYHLLNEGNWGYKETEGGIIKLDEHG